MSDLASATCRAAAVSAPLELWPSAARRADDHRRPDHGGPRRRARALARRRDGRSSSGRTTNGETGQRNADIWSVPADGSAAPQPFIAGDVERHDAGFSRRRQAHRVHLVARRRAAGVRRRRRDGTIEKQVTKLAAGVQGPMVFSPDGSRVAYRVGRVPRVRGRSLQRRSAPTRTRRIRSRRIRSRACSIATGPTGARTCAITCSSTEVATRRDARRHARRLRLAAVLLRGRGDLVLARRQPARVRLESRRQRRRVVDDEPGRVDRARSPAARRGGSTRQQGGGRAAGVDAGRHGRSSCAASGGRTSNRIAGISTSYDVAGGQPRTVFETPDLSVEDFAFDA